MNIALLVLDITDKGGVERMASFLANELSIKYNIIIISLRKKYGAPFFDISNKTRIIYIESRGKILNNAIAVRRVLNNEKTDCLINVDTGMALVGILSCFMSRISVITWEHSNYYNNWESKKFPYIRKFAARFSTVVVTLTQLDKENYLRGIKKCAPVYVIPNPIEIRDYEYCKESCVIMSAGQLLPIKQYDKMIDVAKTVLELHPSWKWIICGDGPERESIKQRITKLNLQDHIELVGAVTNIHDYYNKAAIFVMTSKMEGLPMVLLEAKAHRIPIVSFDIMTGPSDIVQDGINGFLIASNDTVAMADKINKLIEDADLRTLFSDNSHMNIDKFAKETIIRQWSELIERI